MKKSLIYAVVLTLTSTAIIAPSSAIARTDDEHKINTNISVNGKTILLAFNEPVAPNTKFDIDLNKIKRRNLGKGSAYSFLAREVGIDAEIPIGVAWFRLY